MATYVLGISALYHDAACALLRDGELVAAAQEERFSRIKQDPSLPIRAVAWALGEAGIEIGDVDWLVYYEKPLRKFERILTTAVATFPRAWRAFPRYMHSWLSDKLWVRNSLSDAFGVRPDRILFSEHHLSHAASAFLASPFERAAILTVDGVGELATTALWRGLPEAPFIEPLGEVRFPHSIGMLYSSVTAYLGFAVNEGEYKVMGMAPFGRPRFREQMNELIRLDDRGGFSLNLEYFTFHWHPTESYSPKLVALLGPPRFPGAPFTPEGAPGDATPEAVAESQRHADIAASLQAVTEDALLHLARHAKAVTGESNLCMAGGVALNSVANNRLATDGPFDDMWVQPAAGDAGGALGAALWAWSCVLEKPRSVHMEAAGIGRRFGRDAVREYLDDLELEPEDLGSAEASCARAAADLAEGLVIAWFEGGFEWGPRALGHRSILADPRRAEMTEKVNARIKFRESFRPFAPSVLAEAADRYFDIPPAARRMARFMMVAAPVAPGAGETIPAVTHVNGTARAQLVYRESSPVYYQLIEAFAAITGVPVLLNTSFNLKGEPIVSTPVDALATLMRCGLDALYIEGFRVERSRRLVADRPPPEESS